MGYDSIIFTIILTMLNKFFNLNTNFIGPEVCPPNSSHLNSVDYKIWGLIQDYNTWCPQTEAPSDRRLGRHEAEHDQQGYWWMALKAHGVCSCQGTIHFEYFLYWTWALLLRLSNCVPKELYYCRRNCENNYTLCSTNCNFVFYKVVQRHYLGEAKNTYIILWQIYSG